MPLLDSFNTYTVDTRLFSTNTLTRTEGAAVNKWRVPHTTSRRQWLTPKTA